MQLTGRQTQYLRALAHPLKPLVQVGSKGVSDTLILQINEQLLAHELIKVRFNTESVDPSEVMDVVVERTQSLLVQKLGRTLILYKRHDDKPKIELPGKLRGVAPSAKPERTRGKPGARSDRRSTGASADRRGSKFGAGASRRGPSAAAGARRGSKAAAGARRGSKAAGARRAPKAAAGAAGREPELVAARQPPKVSAPPGPRREGATTSYQRRIGKATALAAAPRAAKRARTTPLPRPRAAARAAAPAGVRKRVRKSTPRRTEDDDT